MAKNRSFPRGPYSLSTLLVAGFCGFVVFGSVILVIYFHYLTEEEEELRFASLARNNAMFLDQARLPQSDLMEERLGRVMGAQVEFGAAEPDSRHGEVWRDARGIHAAFALRNGQEVRFTRDPKAAGLTRFWERWDFWLLMVGFWGLSVWLSWWLARRVTHPLAQVAGVLPAVGEEIVLDDLPKDGPAEVLALVESLRRSQREIRSERDKRRQAERLAILGKMATSLAHEVKNPVAAIRLHGQLLAREVTGSAKESVEMMVNETDRIELLLAQWMSFAKPEPSAFSRWQAVDLLQKIVARLAPQARHADVLVTIDRGELNEDFEIRGDGARLGQVFQNLLLNAIQAIDCGGRVEIRIRDGVIEFADTGIGFSESALANAGVPFYTEREGGMGLGLAVSMEILESHGARMEFENRQPQGAVVRLLWDKTGRTAA